MPDTILNADVAVVGAGAMGAAALYQLARRDIRVVGLDRYDPPHTFGSSHGETRITRQAVGEGRAFAPLVIRSHEIWRELEATTGANLMVSCGYLMLGDRNDQSMQVKKPDFMQTTLDVAKAFNIRHEVLDRSAIIRRFPQFADPAEHDEAYFEPDGGFLYPEACIRTQLAEAERLGATLLRNTTVQAITQDGSSVRIRFSGGEVRATRAIVTAGAWNGKLLGAPFDRLLRVEPQVLYWFEADAAAYAIDRCPGYIRVFGPEEGQFFYGFPTPPGSVGVKVATEQHSRSADADTVSRDVSPAEAEQFYRRHIAGRLAGVSDRLIRAQVCLYTTTEFGSNFVMDRHPAMDRVHVVSACTGHGFKHSAAIGEALAELMVAGRSTIDLAPFALSNFC